MSNQVNKQFYTNTAPQELANIQAVIHRQDNEAFRSITEPYRLELLTHCYRMLGSIEDAEDQVQETFLRAWRRLGTYEGRASFRAWLYKIATNACLDALEHSPKRFLPLDLLSTPADPYAPLPPAIKDPVWLQPFPEKWLSPASASPEARYDAYEGITLAFLVALQVLTPHQRVALILKDVLDWSMAEIADSLGTTLSSVTSLLHRARETMKQRNIAGRRDRIKLGISDTQTRKLLDRYVRAWESADIDGIISLLADDATFPMPPFPFWLQGKLSIRALLSGEIIFGSARDRWKLIATRSNGQPAFALYRLDETIRTYQPFGLQVLTMADGLISGVTTFIFPALFRYFDVPSFFE